VLIFFEKESHTPYPPEHSLLEPHLAGFQIMSSQIPPQFTELVAQQHKSLRFFIRSLGVESAWVDDIAQETFLLLLKKWSQLTDHENLDAWLRTSARNLVRNELRNQKRRPHLINKHLTTFLVEHSRPEPDPYEVAITEERHSALRNCLSLLTPRSRKIVEERYFQDRDSSEIGEEMGMKSSAVRRALFRARESLNACLIKKLNLPAK
jgi:RNA polymerase sigma-70 factor, ECF subfamily